MPSAPSSLAPPTKRRKITASSSVVISTNSLTVSKIAALESTLTEAISSNESLNPLADLLLLTRTLEDPKLVSKAIYAVYRIFVLLLGPGGKFEGIVSEEGKAVRAWIVDRVNEYADYLGGLLKDEEVSLRTSALQILFSLLKHLSTSLSKSFAGQSQPQFHVPFFKNIISFLVLAPSSPRLLPRPDNSSQKQTSDGLLDLHVRTLFLDTWLDVQDDIRWFFMRDAQPLLLSHSSPQVRQNLLSLLERITTFPTEAKELNSWWVEELGAKPPKPKSTKSKSKANQPAGTLSESESDDEPAEDNEGGGEDDWRKFFDEPKDGDDTKSKKGAKAGPSVRLNKLTVHQSLHSLPSHRAVFTRLWLTLLPQLRISTEGKGKATDNEAKNAEREKKRKTEEDMVIRALNVMHRGVMPHLTRAVMCMDWVGGCVDYGGVIGLLALNALFVLMKEYNLDYPSFYTRLYSFLDKDLLYLKHRARFFRLTELFLSSTHLPATLLASFVKRLARLSLSAPPSSIVIVIPFVYNVLKQHPALMVMIHREEAEDAGEFNDPFDFAESNPNLTNALNSSLWEIQAHTRHYHAGVSTLAKIFGEAFTKPNYPLEDFLDHTYGTLFDAEVKRPIKKEPALRDPLVASKDVFPSKPVHAAGDGVQAGAVNFLWTFTDV
ncbi:CBF-domain-containing protein [Stereum hirsutum FP-91666 SS1]|uniref:CBF-domain-containing protein n=1 Tax=Stereum hirsutum (strain FP-91666) TaxID=721885 RepID=UPI000440D995|nr:CBF-domain-containing protein [Stereum hirsutum FP-91666 SS1]EIM90507.1 CBF-domain-containing protein [Stereum hirsutum FP-91666 SS1]